MLILMILYMVILEWKFLLLDILSCNENCLLILPIGLNVDTPFFYMIVKREIYCFLTSREVWSLSHQNTVVGSCLTG